MRGSITLDFLLSLVLILATIASFFFLAYTQVENTVIASAQYQAEAMAMSIGSSINHFAAIQPGAGSFVVIGLNGFDSTGFSVDIQPDDCKVSIDTVNELVVVEITAHRMESIQSETIIAQYPIVDVSNCCTVCLDTSDMSCNGRISVTETGGCIEVHPV